MYIVHVSVSICIVLCNCMFMFFVRIPTSDHWSVRNPR